MKNECQPITIATRQGRRQWFSVGIFPLRLLFCLTGNRPQSAPACSFLRYASLKKSHELAKLANIESFDNLIIFVL